MLKIGGNNNAWREIRSIYKVHVLAAPETRQNYLAQRGWGKIKYKWVEGLVREERYFNINKIRYYLYDDIPSNRMPKTLTNCPLVPLQ